MKKIKLDLDSLDVTSFETLPDGLASSRGTVEGQLLFIGTVILGATIALSVDKCSELF